MKKKAAVIVAHGSRSSGAERDMELLAEKVRHISDVPVETAFLEFSEKTLENILEKLVLSGVKRIRVIPLFLFEGVHVRENISEHIRSFAAKHPEVEIERDRVLGKAPGLPEIIAARIKK